MALPLPSSDSKRQAPANSRNGHGHDTSIAPHRAAFGHVDRLRSRWVGAKLGTKFVALLSARCDSRRAPITTRRGKRGRDRRTPRGYGRLPSVLQAGRDSRRSFWGQSSILRAIACRMKTSALVASRSAAVSLASFSSPRGEGHSILRRLAPSQVPHPTSSTSSPFCAQAEESSFVIALVGTGRVASRHMCSSCWPGDHRRAHRARTASRTIVDDRRLAR